MKLFHGSNVNIEKIDLSKGRPAKDFVLLNRGNKNFEQVHDYDIVFGPIANDAVAVSIALFTDGFISKEELLNRLKYRKETYQYFFSTEKALALLTVDHE